MNITLSNGKEVILEKEKGGINEKIISNFYGDDLKYKESKEKSSKFWSYKSCSAIAKEEKGELVCIEHISNKDEVSKRFQVSSKNAIDCDSTVIQVYDRYLLAFYSRYEKDNDHDFRIVGCRIDTIGVTTTITNIVFDVIYPNGKRYSFSRPFSNNYNDLKDISSKKVIESDYDLKGHKVSFKINHERNFINVGIEGRKKEEVKRIATKKRSIRKTRTVTPKENEVFNEEITLEKKEIKKPVQQVEPPKEKNRYDVIKSLIDLNIPLYLVGEAGSGKNYTLEKIANELDHGFYFTNSISQEYKLTGFIDANGTYHETSFYKACLEASRGWNTVFFLDELDASIPEVVILLNMAIANGYFEFPNGVLHFGKFLKFVSAGNTSGNGGDEVYNGRSPLDGSTLDRFIVVDFPYDIEVERQITNNNEKLINIVHGLRKIVKKRNLRLTFSYRCMINTTKLLNSGFTEKQAYKLAIIKELDDYTKNVIKELCTQEYFEDSSFVKSLLD